MRKQVAVEPNGCCWYCGKPEAPTFETDHQIPRSRGGLGVENNTVLSCVLCNGAKSNRTVDEFRLHLAEQFSIEVEKVTFFGETGRSYPLQPKDYPRDDESTIIMKEVQPAIARMVALHGISGTSRLLKRARGTVISLCAGKHLRLGTLYITRMRLIEHGFIKDPKQ